MKFLFLIFAACLGIQGHAFAANFEYGQFTMARAEKTQQARISLSEATQKVQERTGGRVLAAQELRDRNAYRIKVLTPQGEVRIVIVDAVTGEMN